MVRSLPLQKLQPHTLQPFEETHPPSVRQHALFENFYPRRFDLAHFAVEVTGVDGYMLDAPESVDLPLRTKIHY